MPIQVVPNRIELDNFLGGYMPDASEVDVPLNGLPDVLNLLPNRASGGLEQRPGFLLYSIIDPSGRDTTGDECHFLFYFEAIISGARKKYLIAILTDGTDNQANNQAFVTYDIGAGGPWVVRGEFQAPKSNHEHWGGAASNVWYGGTGGIPMYSWDPSSGTFTADAAAQNYRELVAPGSFNDTDTERPTDFAFKEGDKVLDSGGQAYSAARGIRYERWEDGQRYAPGDKVSRWADHAGTTENYWKSFKCFVSHIAGDDNDQPGTGANYELYWKDVTLDDPAADDGEQSDDWFFIPSASEAIIGTFHGFRLWLRRHDNDSWAWAQYSAPFKPEKGVDIADLVFDPADWSAASDIDGDGGGWIPLREGDGDGIRGFQSYGSYLIIFKRWMSFVVAGTEESTWNIRHLSDDVGTVGPRSFCEHKGLIYTLAPDGLLHVTDGSRMEPAPGAYKVHQFLNDRLDVQLGSDDDENWLPGLTSYRDFIYISLTGPDDVTPTTLVYYPGNPELGIEASFWLTDLPILDTAVGRIDGALKFWFVPTVKYGGSSKPRVFRVLDDPDENDYRDTDLDSTDRVDQSVRMRTAWLQFGAGTRNERRIRRWWALGDAFTNEGATLTLHKNFASADVTAASRTITGSRHGEFIEGKVANTDAYAVSLEFEATSAGGQDPVRVNAIGVDTEPRRTRFHRGAGL